MTLSGLQAFYEYAVNEGLFEVKQIKDLPSSACTQLGLEVIDYDKTKERVAAKLKLPEQPKSCDALKISFAQESVVFIEMKSFNDFKTWQLSKKQREEHERIIVAQIEKHNIPKKIEDSIMVLDQIWEWSGIVDQEKINIRTIILTDIPLREERNSEAFIEFTILYLADGTISEDILIQAKILQTLEYQIKLYEKPLLMTCQEIERYFSAG